MRTLNEYVTLVQKKYELDHEITGISWPECVDLVIDKAFFDDEISYPIVDPLKEKVIEILKISQKNP